MSYKRTMVGPRRAVRMSRAALARRRAMHGLGDDDNSIGDPGKILRDFPFAGNCMVVQGTGENQSLRPCTDREKASGASNTLDVESGMTADPAVTAGIIGDISSWIQSFFDTTPPASVLSASDFNSTMFAGVCKPTNKAALLAVQEMQRQMNRVAQVKSLPKIGADGDIGPGTMGLLRSLASAGASIGDTSSCMSVGPAVPAITASLKALADSLGAPKTVGGGAVASAPSFVPPGATTPVKAGTSLVGGFSGLSTIEKIAVVGALGGAAVVFFGKKRRR